MYYLYKLSLTSGEFYIGVTHTPYLRESQHRKGIESGKGLPFYKKMADKIKNSDSIKVMFDILHTEQSAKEIAAVENDYISKNIGNPMCFNSKSKSTYFVSKRTQEIKQFLEERKVSMRAQWEEENKSMYAHLKIR